MIKWSIGFVYKCICFQKIGISRSCFLSDYIYCCIAESFIVIWVFRSIRNLGDWVRGKDSWYEKHLSQLFIIVIAVKMIKWSIGFVYKCICFQKIGISRSCFLSDYIYCCIAESFIVIWVFRSIRNLGDWVRGKDSWYEKLICCRGWFEIYCLQIFNILIC